MQNGLEEPIRQQRLTLFGKNEIDIEGKSTLSLLVDEVGPLAFILHPVVLTLAPHSHRSSTRFMYFKSSASYCGLSMTIITMHSASLLSRRLA